MSIDQFNQLEVIDYNRSLRNKRANNGKSKLDSYRNFILEARRRGYSYRSIQEWLRIVKRVRVHYSTILRAVTAWSSVNEFDPGE